MLREELASDVLECLRRVRSVPKLALGGGREARRVAVHLETLAVEATLTDARRLVLVDDVLTSGGTLYASHVLLREAFPEIAVSQLAFVRSLGDTEIDVGGILAPTRGTITYYPRQGTTHREP